MEATDKYLVSEEFLDDYHSQLGCTHCHGGENVADMERAHQGLDPRPSANLEGVCADCHGDITEKYEGALHNTVEGIRRGLEELAYPRNYEENPGLLQAFDEKCSTCHASCGECHVSRPRTVEGGLFAGHIFTSEAPIDETCWGCHGARSAGEYIGNVDGQRTIPDIHYQAGMSCSDCHDVSNFHGSGEFETGMREIDTLPSCQDCHRDIYSENSEIQEHAVHDESMMSCNVCHSIQNNNCYGCHVAEDGSTPVESRFQFKIGLNEHQDEDRPYEYVTLRHVPTTEGMLDVYESDLLENFDNIPTWKMTTSHNIQRATPQTRNCDNCHGNEDIFLTEDDLTEDCPEANRKIMVEEVPGF